MLHCDKQKIGTYLIMFTSYYFATKTDSILDNRHIRHDLIATPPALHSNCGLCIRIFPLDIEHVIGILEEEKISHSGIYKYVENQWTRWDS
ncbi:DUF3343 domain-containing protein [Veillonella montpellierensis]|nr:DUF3343 domain-containing protein [Veillonella montpellierensis]